MRHDLQQELVALAAQAARIKQRLGLTEAFCDPYPSELAEVHATNAVRLNHIVRGMGWPGVAEVGPEGAEAAFRMLSDATGHPGFMRAGLLLIERQGYLGNALPGWVATVMDRVRLLEGREQVYGTQFDWSAEGTIEPMPLAGADTVDMRRQSVSLDLLEDFLAGVRALGAPPPADLAERRQRVDAFAVRAGWR